MRTLVVLPVSPWSERARWALDHHGLAYRVVEHSPFIGERKLRRLVGPTKPRATVPVLLDGERAFTDSWDIAKHADEVGASAKLFLPGREDDVRRWCGVADACANGARALVNAGMLRDAASLDETLPPPIPGFERPLLRPVTRYGTRWFARKYGIDLDDDTSQAERAVRAALEELRRALDEGGRYLLGSFSYADIAMTSVVQAVRPVTHARYPLGTATRRVWTHEGLAKEFGDVVAWRDALYRDHRP